MVMPLRVDAIQVGDVERAGDGAAAEQRGVEAHALLVGEADDLDGERQPRPLRVQRATHSMPAITPSMPSYLPASRTVSRCEPSIRHGAPGRSPS